jgi:hypothetical protein
MAEIVSGRRVKAGMGNDIVLFSTTYYCSVNKELFSAISVILVW